MFKQWDGLTMLFTIPRSRPGFTHLRTEHRSCRIEVILHSDVFEFPDRPSYNIGFTDGSKTLLVPFSALLLNWLIRWWERSQGGSEPVKRAVAFKISTAIIQFRANVNGLTHYSLLKQKDRADLDFLVKQLFLFLTSNFDDVMTRMVEMKLFGQESMDRIMDGRPFPQSEIILPRGSSVSRIIPFAAEASLKAIELLEGRGRRAAIFGSLACWASGAPRLPNVSFPILI